MEEMVNVPVRRLDSPNGRLFAEWQLLLKDLESCLAAARLWKSTSQAEKTETNSVIAASLFRDAIVRFMACFDDATPVRLDAAELYGPSRIEGGLEYFRWLSTLRDTWIAHRHGASRQAHTAIAVSESTGAFLGFCNMIVALASFDYREEDGLIPLIEMAIAHTAKQCQSYNEVVRAEVEAMQSDQLLKLPRASMVVPNERTRHMGRRKYGNITHQRREQMEIQPEFPESPVGQAEGQ